MWHRLRIATASFCLVLCIAFVALWVQSYFKFYSLYGEHSAIGRVLLKPAEGRVKVFYWPATNMGEIEDWRWKVGTLSRDYDDTRRILEENKGVLGFHVGVLVMEGYTGDLGFHVGVLGFHVIDYTDLWKAIVPYWFLTLVTCALAFLLKPKPRLIFSLSDLLIFTTVVAIVLGGITALARIAD